MVIADRVQIKESIRRRLAESVESALNNGKGFSWVALYKEGKEKPELLEFSRSFICVACDKKLHKPTPVLFSFNHPLGACPECKGFGKTLKYSTERVVPDESLSLNEGAIEPWTKPSYRWFFDKLAESAKKHAIDLDIAFSKLTEAEREKVFKGTEDFAGIDGFFEHLEKKKYKLHIRVFLSRYKTQFLCEECNGTRLKESALSVLVGGLNIAQIAEMTLKEAREFFIGLELTPYQREVSKEVLKQIAIKLEFLNRTGLSYITLDRLTKTLSGGEAQRVTLANQMGSALSGVLYILDEPSVGLHPRDIDTLIGQIKALAARGNTVRTRRARPTCYSLCRLHFRAWPRSRSARRTARLLRRDGKFSKRGQHPYVKVSKRRRVHKNTEMEKDLQKRLPNP